VAFTVTGPLTLFLLVRQKNLTTSWADRFRISQPLEIVTDRLNGRELSKTSILHGPDDFLNGVELGFAVEGTLVLASLVHLAKVTLRIDEPDDERSTASKHSVCLLERNLHIIQKA
jgi:hypothetical protein